MMVKKLMLCALLFPAMLAAQKTLTFPAQMDKMTGVNKRFYIDKVIDVRNAPATNYVGSVQTGALNSKNDALLKRPLADELTTVVRQLLPNAKDSIELILKVNRLKVWEQTFLGTEEAYAFGDFQLILKQDTAYYLVDTFNGFAKKRSGWDVTRLHIKNIVSVLTSALDTFQTRQNWLNPTTGLQALTAADVLKKSTPNILIDSVKNKGVYRHFGEFLSNKPTLPMAYREKNGKKIAFTIDEEGQKKELKDATDAWGFCDGTDIFVGQQGDFFPLQLDKDGVFFNGYDVQKRAKRQQTGAILFGVLGAAIASANKGDLEPMKVNMNSGECVPQK